MLNVASTVYAIPFLSFTLGDTMIKVESIKGIYIVGLFVAGAPTP